MSFAKIVARSIGKSIGINLSSKHSQKHFDHAKQSATDAFKTDSKIAIQKTAGATDDLIGNRIADKLQESQKFHHKIIQREILNMMEKYIDKDICLQKKDRKLLMI